ncbi:hypothetical protein NMG60_11001921 [Bertholletia excelsa]
MADPTPLISESCTTIDPKPPSSLDEIIQGCIGDFGWAQFLQAAFVSLAWVFDAQQAFISVFTDALPSWHCTTPTSCTTADADICLFPPNAWAWDMPIHTSTVSEWSLACAGSIMMGLPASSFFLGCLAGGFILATLADSSLGRKNMLFLSCLLMSLSGLCTVVSTNIWTYSALRFICGFARAMIGTCALVLSTELVGKRWRAQVGVIGFFCFTLGFLSLPAIAYLNRGSSWRLLYFWTCTPAIFYCLLLHFIVNESPRWLFVQGRREEFVTTLKSITPPANRSKYSATSSFWEKLNFINTCEPSESRANLDLYSAINILIQKSWALRRLCAVMGIGFGIGMVYYGMPLGVGSLGFNLYLSVTFNALSELPSSLITFFLIGTVNRKGSLLGFTTLSGICSVICALLSNQEIINSIHYDSRWLTKGLRIGGEMVSFFSGCTASYVLLIYTLELFPTCVRNCAVSMVRQALVLGGVFSPVLVAAGRKNELMSYGVFGVTIAFCGLFVTFLPETKGCTSSDTMDEEEHKVMLSSPKQAPAPSLV